MLANLLPGIRDFRTPLATGYIWLVTFWLWLPNHLKQTTPTAGVPGDIARIAHYSGRVGIGIALSFLAYLIGVLSALFNLPLTRFGSLVSLYTSRQSRRTKVPLPAGDELSPDDITSTDHLRLWLWGVRKYSGAKSAAVDSLMNARYSVTGLAKITQAEEEMLAEGARGLTRRSDPPKKASQETIDKLYYYLTDQVYTQGNALLGKEAELFAAYDRLNAEYEFRIGVTPPLIALILTLAVRWTPLWLLALLPLLLLLKTGSERRMEAGDVLADAFRRKLLSIVPPPDLVSQHEVASTRTPLTGPRPDRLAHRMTGGMADVVRRWTR